MYVTFRVCMSRSREGEQGRRIKESTWSTCCEFLSELVSLLQLVKPPLIYVLRGHDNMEEAWVRICEKFPNANPKNSTFTASLDKFNRLVVKIKRLGGKSYPLFNSDGEVNDKLPKAIVKNLGPTSEEVIMDKEGVISKGKERIKKLFTKREKDTVNNREAIDGEIEEIQSQNDQLQREIEVIEERMSLRDRVKMVFKKYGFTVFSVVTAVGVVIGVIVSDLKSGLTKVAKGIGGGLKTIGKKIGDILPGMIGAIASFIFKTAGEVIGFLGNFHFEFPVGKY